MYALKRFTAAVLASSLLAGCQLSSDKIFAKKRLNLFKDEVRQISKALIPTVEKPNLSVPLTSMIEKSDASVDLEQGFRAAVKNAVMTDPSIIADQQNLAILSSSIEATEATKEFQVSGTVYAGFEDVSDETRGIALVLTANRLLFDSGAIDATIAAQKLELKSAELALDARINQRAMELTELWIDYYRYKNLNEQIEDRLMVLGPLIDQLERVAEAGIGDVSRVAAAQRTVSVIEATQTEVAEKFEQSRLAFLNSFGNLPMESNLNLGFISEAVPATIDSEMAAKAPALRSLYAAYQAKEASVAAVRAKDGVNVGFETRIQRPFGGSTRDSDEQLGVVLRKTLYHGKKLDAEIAQAELEVKATIAELQSTYRQGEMQVRSFEQSIDSLNKAIVLASKNAADMEEEIAYLKQQLIIGGSTLDSVLSAEARLYDVKSRKVNFAAEKQKSEVKLLSTLGKLTSALRM